MNTALIPRTALALALGAALAACSVGSAGDPSGPAAMQIPVAYPEQQDVPVVLDLPGHVEAIERGRAQATRQRLH